MLPRRLPIAALACLLLLLTGFAGCGGEDEQSQSKNAQESSDEAHREGLFVDIGGLGYNVYITRQLNIRDVEDRAYYQGPDAPPGSAYFGVFIRVCNEGDDAKSSAADFKITDTQGEEYEPVELPEDNVFAYHAGDVGSGKCIPQDGSAAATGPTGGSLLLFELPDVATENRPLELEIKAPLDVDEAEQQQAAIELDI